MKRTILTARRQRCGYGYDAEGGAGMVANLAWRPGPDEPLATDNASSVDRGLRDDAGRQGDHGGILAGSFLRAKPKRVEGAGHLAPITHAATVNALIAEFIAKVDTRGGESAGGRGACVGLDIWRDHGGWLARDRQIESGLKARRHRWRASKSLRPAPRLTRLVHDAAAALAASRCLPADPHSPNLGPRSRYSQEKRPGELAGSGSAAVSGRDHHRPMKHSSALSVFSIPKIFGCRSNGGMLRTSITGIVAAAATVM